MIIKNRAILFLSTTFLGGSISGADALLPLQRTFSGKGAPPTPLPECHGDCDNDSHCAEGLTCFQRFDYEEVPGCTGGADFRNADFCAVRATANTLWMMGNNGSPSKNFPLKLCEGDCDTDAECDTGLVCEQRTGNEPVPGCIGEAVPGEDYCRPAVVTTPAPTPQATPPPTLPPTSLQVVFTGLGAPPNPLAECHGDCDDDTQCEGDLVCFQRSGTEAVPGCPGDGPSGVDFCAYRATENTVWLKGDNNSPADNFPLGLCEGDCDSNADCKSGLICQQRTGNEAIPGCIGNPEPGEDYCRPADPTPPPTPAPTNPPSSPPTPNPTNAVTPPVTPEPTNAVTPPVTPEPTNAVTPPVTPEPTNAVTPEPTNAVTPNPTPPTAKDLHVVFTGSGSPPYPLIECHGDCDDDTDCAGDLVCFQRSGNEAVPGCTGSTTTGTDFCAYRATENTVWLKGDNNSPAANFPLGLCEGDCDSNADCKAGLICQQRTGNEAIPGCIGNPEPGEDYCRPDGSAPTTPQPTSAVTPNPTPPTSTSTLEVVFTGSGAPPSPLSECQGDCDNDSQCAGDLVCFQRSGTEAVPGCTGSTTSGTDFCAYRATENTVWLKGDNNSPAANFPLGLCEGDCDSNADCKSGLICQQRTGNEAIPGCIGNPEPGEDYCRPDGSAPTTPPGPQPTYAPNSVGATFVPGDLSQPCDGLMLSRGMDCRLLTTANEFVQYDTGGQSTVRMHGKADGAAVIAHPSDGGWYYTSNSENGSGGGGVGTLRFDAQGQVIGYKRDLTGTSRNCGGGKTYWNTWVTCEEDGSNGFCYEVDPFTGHTAKTNVVNVGGNYESFAYDNQDPDVEARFFTTEDSGNGALVRYTPTEAAFNTGDNYDILTSEGGTYDYLVLNADGTFTWSSSASAGANSASTYFPNAEGIDVINRQLFFVSKVNRELFELDLANMTWIVQSTVSGAFDQQPDQIQKVVGDDEFLYFCEDGGSNSDIHGRNKDGEFFTIVRGDGYSTETTGLAFSPDNMFMYVAFQSNSNVYAFWRKDGLSFGATKADIKYHQV